MSLPGAVSPLAEKIRGVVIPVLANSCGQNSNALAYIECAVLT